MNAVDQLRKAQLDEAKSWLHVPKSQIKKRALIKILVKQYERLPYP